MSAIENPNHTTFSIPSMLHQHQMIDSTRITNLDSILEDSFKTKNILTNSLINIPRQAVLQLYSLPALFADDLSKIADLLS